MTVMHMAGSRVVYQVITKVIEMVDVQVLNPVGGRIFGQPIAEVLAQGIAKAIFSVIDIKPCQKAFVAHGTCQGS
ncbi:hypothetical protein FXW78_33280 [Rhodococcus opacus]|nr:hypothetical protein [Rhodococcus opacus]